MARIGSRYELLYKHYEQCLARFGDSHLGVDWPELGDVETRYNIMLNLIPPGIRPGSWLLDFGCGLGHFKEFLERNSEAGIRYLGLDISSKFVLTARKRRPDLTFRQCDVLVEPLPWREVDWVIFNGVFTEKRELSHSEMWNFLEEVLKAVLPHVRFGFALNVMSTEVDWVREDLFHVPVGDMVSLVARLFSRNICIRHDYGLFEYTICAYRYPQT